MSRPRGKSLIEVLVVITLTSAALGVCAMTLTATFRTEQQLRKDREQQTNGVRLTELFRADAHAAARCTAGDQGCLFTLPSGRTIRYSLSGHRISREVTAGDKTLHRDSFALPPDAAVALAVQPKAGRDFALLTITSSGPGRPFGVPVRQRAIEAVVNLHGQEPEESP